MKNTIKLFGLFVVLSIVLASCKDEMTNEAFENGTAIVEGTILVNSNLSNDTAGIINEYVPQGTTVYATINAIDLVQFPSFGVNYGVIIYETEVGANGSFSFEIEANEKSVRVNFSADDIKLTQTQFDETGVEKIFYLPEIYNESVRTGGKKITELIFFEK